MYHIKTPLWKYHTEKAAWHFLTIENNVAKKIRQTNVLQKARGFGSIRVRATIGTTTWPTSIFPTKEGAYVLPVKASVRKREHIAMGDMVECTFEPVFW